MGTNLDVATLASRSFLSNLPSAVVIQTTPQSIPDSTDTAITFQSESLDNWGGFSGTHPTRYTFQIRGTYMLDASISWAGNDTGRRYHDFRISGTTHVVPGSATDIQSTDTNNLVTSTPTVLYPFNVGDYIEVIANQTSGAALSTTTSGATSAFITTLTVKWVHR